ncbi:hypothetical protein PUNSTDRAFT_21655, partial [Punctularia strigosozonata HHB-11173 SS5]|uniref:uncharacterized protein n=1 Tax=Punctularia strigosozonata (strain HHB-11173) TaxID=741275 RepID=UPI000441671D
LLNFAKDYKLAKRLLVNSPRCPQFPDAEWDNILKGRPVDFDRVLSGTFSIAFNDKQTEKIGEIEIAVGAAAPAKIVRTHGEWTIAWEQYVAAITFVFPWRTSELHGYGQSVLRLFSTIIPSLHNRVICYDKAVRTRVAQRRDLLLTDVEGYADLKLAWLS